jgi:hypothetical protein
LGLKKDPEIQKRAVLLVELLRYHPSLYSDLLGMHSMRKNIMAATMTIENTPACGWVAYSDKNPIAAGFLRRVEGGYGQFDTFVSNPSIPSAIRHFALTSITENLLNDAKSLGLSGIVSYIQDKSIIKRAEAIGFRRLPHAVFALPLPQEK